jgi:hypothetical protein
MVLGTTYVRTYIRTHVNTFADTRVQIEHYLKNDLKYKHSGATGKLGYYVHVYVRTVHVYQYAIPRYTVYHGTCRVHGGSTMALCTMVRTCVRTF